MPCSPRDAPVRYSPPARRSGRLAREFSTTASGIPVYRIKRIHDLHTDAIAVKMENPGYAILAINCQI
ncbi:hypothetical protein MES4922_10080 [Mesorhizobium ventifaucium]|uniref:Uncharacterized protein n=1 Tax=Mesorhizobium ventifaucium TaxID=666020 RepID=A0ABN8JE85_9HYPH|nr:hypothetical protein MES4922_10080 [Mesorhizobium ventifaucium]